jgi:hypothetical protein
MKDRAASVVACFGVVALVGCGSGSVGGSGEETGAGAGVGTGTGAGVGSGGGSSTSTSTSTSASGGGGAEAGKVAMFVAQGDLGRTTVSCDDGKSWVGNHSWEIDGDPLACGANQGAHCFEGTCSYLVGSECQDMPCCGDTPDIARGLAYGDGQFVATWGWGAPGAVRRTANGVDWVTTHPDDSFGGAAYGSGHFVVASRSPFWSTDGAD